MLKQPRIFVRIPQARLFARSAVVMLLLSFACRLNATFDITETGNAPVAGASSPASVTFPELQNLNLAEHPSLKQQGLTLDELHSVVVEDGTLAISQPATGGDLSFFSGINLVAQAPNLPDVVVASATAPIAKINTVLLVATGKMNLLEYAKSDGFTFVIEATYATPTSEAITLTLEPSLRLVVNEPAGTCKHQ